MDKTITTTTARTEVLDIAIVGALLLVACLIVPLSLLGAPKTVTTNAQYFVGPTVNCARVFAAIRFRGKIKIATLICVPSVCTILLGLLPGATLYAVFMVPAIWLGNGALVLIFRALYRAKRANYISTAGIAIAVKCAIIFGGYLLLRSFGAFPTPVAAVLFTTFGLMQIITATIGCALAYAAIKSVKFHTA